VVGNLENVRPDRGLLPGYPFFRLFLDIRCQEEDHVFELKPDHQRAIIEKGRVRRVSGRKDPLRGIEERNPNSADRPGRGRFIAGLPLDSFFQQRLFQLKVGLGPCLESVVPESADRELGGNKAEPLQVVRVRMGEDEGVDFPDFLLP